MVRTALGSTYLSPERFRNSSSNPALACSVADDISLILRDGGGGLVKKKKKPERKKTQQTTALRCQGSMALLLWTLTRCVLVVLTSSSSLSLLLLMWCVSAGVVGGVAVKCGPCEKSRCPELHYCEGQAVQDHCGCCTVCSSSKYQPHLLLSDGGDDGHGREGNACAKVKCPKFKVCMENMQGLPLCTCPGPFICKQRRSRQRAVCGTDGVTYDSRCYLRIAACNSATRIKVARRGACTGAESPRPRECDSPKSCRRRKNQHPVCGTDGKTHQSRCHMKIAACQKRVKIKLKHHGKCAVASGRGLLTDARAQSPAVPGRDAEGKQEVNGRPRKERRRRKKKGGSDVAVAEEGKRKRRKQRRDKRKQRQQRRRKRRKTRGQGRPRRYKVDRGHVLRNIGYSYWK